MNSDITAEQIATAYADDALRKAKNLDQRIAEMSARLDEMDRKIDRLSLDDMGYPTNRNSTQKGGNQ
jgi:hypothetical protein